MRVDTLTFSFLHSDALLLVALALPPLPLAVDLDAALPLVEVDSVRLLGGLELVLRLLEAVGLVALLVRWSPLVSTIPPHQLPNALLPALCHASCLCAVLRGHWLTLAHLQCRYVCPTV
jgi:hypothetical protein